VDISRSTANYFPDHLALMKNHSKLFHILCVSHHIHSPLKNVANVFG
jgi:hypothetical protein